MDFNLRQDHAMRLADVLAISHAQGTVPSRVEERYVHTVLALARYVDTLGALNPSHITRTAALARSLGRMMGMEAAAVENLAMGGLLHDVGKVFIPESILTKQGSLNAAEWELMRRHPEMGIRILKPAPSFSAAMPAVETHHEKFDGSGYPVGLRGESIPLDGRIISVADAYTAMTSGRTYRAAFSTDEAMAELERCQGSHFDPMIVTLFIRMVAEGGCHGK
jgi:HD-GYP domain-containing protein (c-di-GMP phosphodiesterase class II)